MIYTQAFNDLVKEPFQHLPEYVQFKTENPEHTPDQFNSFYQTTRQLLGVGPYNTPDKVVKYCYIQQPLHYEAFKVLMSNYRTTFERNVYPALDRVTMIDFGCGPMTSCLALAEGFASYQEAINFDEAEPVDTRLKMHYIGIDLEPYMLIKAEEFAHRTDIFHEQFTCELIPSCSNIDIEQLKQRKFAGSVVLFNFSYILGQPSINDAVLNEWAEFIQKVCSVNSDGSAYLLYLNEGREAYNQKYITLKTRLGLDGQVPGLQSYRYRTTNGFSRPGNLVCELLAL